MTWLNNAVFGLVGSLSRRRARSSPPPPPSETMGACRPFKQFAPVSRLGGYCYSEWKANFQHPSTEIILYPLPRHDAPAAPTTPPLADGDARTTCYCAPLLRRLSARHAAFHTGRGSETVDIFILIQQFVLGNYSS